MVACQATLPGALPANERLIECKERLVDEHHVPHLADDKVFDDDVALVCVRERVSCAGDQIARFIQIEPKRDRKRKRRGLARLVSLL